MPYILEVVAAGKTVEVHRYFSGRYGKRDTPRRKNVNPTPEDVALVNERNAEIKLRRLLNTNFAGGDIHLVLTYKRELRPKPEDATEQLARFMRQARKIYKDNKKELKYVTVTEYETSAIHHHLVIPNIDPRLLQDIWPYGKARPTYLDDTGQYGALAHYLIKETRRTFKKKLISRKRWNASKNLTQPTVICKKIVAREDWRKEIKPYTGYYVDRDSIDEGYHEITGCKYRRYIMVKIE